MRRCKDLILLAYNLVRRVVDLQKYGGLVFHQLLKGRKGIVFVIPQSLWQWRRRARNFRHNRCNVLLCSTQQHAQLLPRRKLTFRIIIVTLER